MTVVCNRPGCMFCGASGFCGKEIVILNRGVCSEWWDKDGRPRPVQDSARRPLDAEIRSEAAESLEEQTGEAATPA